MDTMDTKAAMKSKDEVDALIQVIKARMPDTYDNIVLKAKAIGNEAYTLVRRGLKGEPNCFYAFEKFNVVGTPFSLGHEEALPIAQYMVQFGSTFCCMFGDKVQPKAGS